MLRIDYEYRFYTWENVIQEDKLSFSYFPDIRYDIEDWLKETSAIYDIVPLDGGEELIVFEDIQGAIEFKLRFY